MLSRVGVEGHGQANVQRLQSLFRALGRFAGERLQSSLILAKDSGALVTGDRAVDEENPIGTKSNGVMGDAFA